MKLYAQGKGHIKDSYLNIETMGNLSAVLLTLHPAWSQTAGASDYMDSALESEQLRTCCMAVLIACTVAVSLHISVVLPLPILLPFTMCKDPDLVYQKITIVSSTATASI